MSTVDTPIAAELPSQSRTAEIFARIEALLSRIGDRMNPILIKEARQALKSRQFTVTFILLLVAGWCWSIIGIAWVGPDVYWSANGPSMFFGYFLILAFPLLVVVPYGAYRSLSSEREDRTFELLSITTLRPRQIIGGKLAGAVLQMVVYLSAISPCLAFTYLLRGLDIVTILMIVVYLFLGSLGLSLFCLLLATGTSEKYQQVILSVGTVFGLGYAFVGACVLAAEMLAWNVGLDEREFWIVNAALFTAYASYFALFYLAAAAQLSFVGSNRSTPLRMASFVQQVLFVSWMGGVWYSDINDVTVLVPTLLLAGIHWYAMGVFMTGEPATLSPRIKRDLPQSFLGRALHTWFNPGPASGFVFAVVNFTAIAALVFIALAVQSASTSASWFRPESARLLAGIGLCYLVIYLGVGRLLLSWMARYSPAPPTIALRLLLHVVLLFIGTAVPLVIQLTRDNYGGGGYSVLQASNPFWTVASILDSSPPYEIYTVLSILSVVAAIVFFSNLPAIAEEVRQIRIARPERVVEEDAELAAAATPAGSTRTNPWDE